MYSRLPWLWIILILLLICLLAGSLIAWRGFGAVTVKPPEPVDQIIRVQAYIDGRSRFAISGKTVQWFNLEFAVPGRHGGQNRPTVINGQNWFPEWPDLGDDENRGQNAISNKYDQLDPPFPSQPLTATIKKIKARGAVRIIQQPKAENQFRLVVELDDSRDPGPADYIVEIHYPKQ